MIENLPRMREMSLAEIGLQSLTAPYPYAYHEMQHPVDVLVASRVIARVIGITDIESSGVIVESGVYTHDVIPPNMEYTLHEDRPSKFRIEAKQTFDGESEKKSAEWSGKNLGELFPVRICEGIMSADIATTVEKGADGNIHHSRLGSGDFVETDFVVATADTMHQLFLKPELQVDTSLRLFLERFPLLLQAILDPDFSLDDDNYDYAREEIEKIPDIALAFYDDQWANLKSETITIFNRGVYNGLRTHIQQRTTPSQLKRTFWLPEWDWLRTPDKLLGRLRQSVGFMIVQT